MKGVAFELEFLVFLGKKTGKKNVIGEKNLVFLGVFFERRRLLSLRTIIGKLKRPVHLCRKKTTKKRNNNT